MFLALLSADCSLFSDFSGASDGAVAFWNLAVGFCCIDAAKAAAVRNVCKVFFIVYSSLKGHSFGIAVVSVVLIGESNVFIGSVDVLKKHAGGPYDVTGVSVVVSVTIFSIVVVSVVTSG